MNLPLLPTFLMDPKLSLVSHAKISRPKIMESKMASFGSDWMVLIQINLFMKGFLKDLRNMVKTPRPKILKNTKINIKSFLDFYL